MAQGTSRSKKKKKRTNQMSYSDVEVSHEGKKLIIVLLVTFTHIFTVFYHPHINLV